ncbi:transcription factor SPT20 homolog isoform X3 [Polistes fuscatus]|uniref:transcription factor SPT20 homolog isoform X3 n=1 Tax=Polistes fuscatus TaxID=30207 RepID=UPI001CA7E2A0|nr:transcription factor SPT20 homolog isoform X3 [Polistes fuscatus]
MDDDQQFCLKWNNHQSTLIQNFDTLLESGTLVDCTLAAEGKYLKAHRVVLSACSPYFEGLLSEHYDKHPVFILKDVKFKELKAMIDYMYRGEVNISQDQLTALLKAAESLQIKGLSESKTGGSNGNNKSVSRVSKVAPQPRSSPLNISYASAGLTIERNRVPRQASSIGDLPEDSHSPQIPKEHSSSREGSQSPTSKKRRKLRRRSAGEDTSVENHEASNSSDIPQQMGVPALAIAPVADEKTNADPTDSLGRSALMTQLTKPADEMLQMPLENPEPSDNLIEPKSEYLEDQEESVEDLTLDDDMNDLNEIEQDTNRAGPSHDTSQHPGLATWHVTGDRSNTGGVVGSVAGAPGTTDEVFLAAQEAAQAHRDSQEHSYVNASRFGDYSCTKCGKRYKNHSSLCRHNRYGCGPTKLKCVCPNCGKIYSRPDTLADHIAAHWLKCPTTGDAIMVITMVDQYTRIINCEDQQNQQQNQQEQQQQQLQQQQQQQEEEQQRQGHICKTCGKTYTRKTALWRHHTYECEANDDKQQQQQQQQQPEEEESSSNTEKIDWNLDNEKTNATTTTTTTQLEQAIGSGQDITCTQVFARELLRDNQSSPNSQDATRCYSCQSCGKSFTRASILQAHAYYRCHLNPVSQLYKSGKNSRFSCYACGSSYSRQNSLMWHVRHECGNPQKCKDCGKTFLYRSSLYRHRNRGCNSFHHIKDLAKPVVSNNDLAQIEIDATITGELVLDPVSV